MKKDIAVYKLTVESCGQKCNKPLPFSRGSHCPMASSSSAQFLSPGDVSLNLNLTGANPCLLLRACSAARCRSVSVVRFPAKWAWDSIFVNKAQFRSFPWLSAHRVIPTSTTRVTHFVVTPYLRMVSAEHLIGIAGVPCGRGYHPHVGSAHDMRQAGTFPANNTVESLRRFPISRVSSPTDHYLPLMHFLFSVCLDFFHGLT